MLNLNILERDYKNMENHKKTALYKALCCVILALAIVMLSQINLISAFEFDNVKEYNLETKTTTIINAFGLGSTIAKAKLITPQINNVIAGENRRVMIFEIENLGDEIYTEALENMKFIDIKRARVNNNKVFSYEYAIYGNVRVNDYGAEICINNENYEGTLICNREIVGHHIENKIIGWEALNNRDIPIGNITIALVTDVNVGDHYDGIPTLFGIDVPEWAEWVEGYNIDLVGYWNADEGSGTNLIDVTDGEFNGTIINTVYNGSGKVGADGMKLDGVSDTVNIGDVNILDQPAQMSLTMWIFPTDSGNAYDTLISKRNPAGWVWAIQDSDDKMSFFIDGSDWDISDSTVDFNAWNFVAVTVNGTSIAWYKNGMPDGTDVHAGAGDSGADDVYLGAFDNLDSFEFQGVMDEVGMWNRTLTAAEILAMYNAAVGMSYTVPGSSNDPIVTLNTPSDNSAYSVDSVTLNCSATDDVEVVNVTLNINAVANYTQDGTSSNFTELYQTYNNLPDSYYNWTCEARDDENNLGSAISTRSFLIDTSAPTATIITPTNGFSVLASTIPYNLSVNATVSDLALGTCLFYNGTGNNSVTCGDNVTALMGGGEHTLGWYVNDTAGNEVYDSIIININYYNHSAAYTDPAIIQETYDFNLTVNANSLGEFNGSFYYNNTAYVADYSDNGTVGYVGYTLQVDDEGLIPFNFTYYINGTMVNANYSHVVNQIQNHTVVAGGVCPSDLSPALHYDFKSEQNDTLLNTTADYIFRYGITNNTLKTTSGTITSTDFTVCMNSTIWNNYSLGYGEIQYQSTGYSDRRHYNFNSERLSNTTVNATLYSLIAGSSTSFLFTIQKGDLSVFSNAYITLNRWYPDEDTYKIVEMSRTDDEGQTVMKVEIEDVDYRVGVYYQNGTLVYLAAPFRLVCIATPCSYSLIVPEEAGNSFENWKNLQVSITYNETTQIFTMIYNDPSQDTDAVNLSVYRDSGISELLICTDSAESYTSVLSCNVSGYSGLLRAVGFRTASPETSIISKMVNQGVEKLGKTPALFITLLIMIFLVSVGVVSPILTVILSVLAFIPALLFGVTPLPILLIIAVMGFIVIHFMKRSVSG